MTTQLTAQIKAAELKGFTLVSGKELTPEQKQLCPFKNMLADNAATNAHSFWFKDGKPATQDSGYFYPVCHSFSWLPY